MNNFTAMQDCKSYITVNSGVTIPTGASTTDVSVTLADATYPAEATNSLDAISQIGVIITVVGTMPAGTQLEAVVKYNDTLTKTLTRTLGRAVTNDTAMILLDGDFLDVADSLDSVTVKFEQDAVATYDVSTEFFKSQNKYDTNMREELEDGLPSYLTSIDATLAAGHYTDDEGFSFYIGTPGDVIVDGYQGGSSITIPDAPAGWHPVKVKKIYSVATGTTASGIIAGKS